MEITKIIYRFALFAGLVLAPVVPSVNPHVGPLGKTCDHYIPKGVVEVDGQGNYAAVQPGDVLCLLPGKRANIKFMNLHGTEQEPIVIQNTRGRTIITGRLFLTGGIGILNSTHLRITGAGVSTQCGAQYSANEQDCGIEITRTHKGIKLDTAQGTIEGIELDHIAISSPREIQKDQETRGISVHPRAGQVVRGISVHHNYIAGTSAEGIYLGSEPSVKLPVEQLGRLEDVEVSYNLVENTDYDGINVKVAVRNLQVHHNVVDNTGSLENTAQQGGIKLVMSVGDVYSNMVLAIYSGIQMGRPLESPGTRYFNNIVIGAKTVGIEVLEDDALVYNNTVVNSGEIGIRAPGEQSKVFDNIIVGTTGTPVEALDDNFSNNFIDSTYKVKFVSPIAKDYRLRSGSPAIDAGGSTGVYPQLDYRGVFRPQGEQPDLGAIEYTGIGESSNQLTIDDGI